MRLPRTLGVKVFKSFIYLQYGALYFSDIFIVVVFGIVHR